MKNKFHAIGWDGIAMLLLSNLLIVFSLGTSIFYLLMKVVMTAQRSPANTRGEILIVPGMQLVANQPNQEFIRRLSKASQISTPNKTPKILILGGLTGGNTISEAQAGRRYLEQQGFDTTQIFLEEKSNNTLENFRFSKQLLPVNEQYPIIVSSRYHLARCSTMAKHVGIAHTLCGAEDSLSLTPRNILLLLKEAYHLHWYHSGRYWATLTRNQKMLARLR